MLFALAAYIVLGAAWSLWTHHGAEFSVPGLIVAAVAMPIMYLLARQKVTVASRLGSRAMHADAIESMTCGWLSLVGVVGLVANLLLAAWWLDAVTSLLPGAGLAIAATRHDLAGVVRALAVRRLPSLVPSLVP